MIDAHVHVAHPDQVRYPRRSDAAALGSSWHASPLLPADALAEVLGHGLRRVVVVQALGVYDDDNRCAADTVAGDPVRLALVAGITVPARASRLRTMLDDLAVRPAGVRLFAIRAADDWADTADDLIDVCAEARATPVLTVFGRHLAAVSRLAARHPHIEMVIDHCAFPELGPGLDDVLDAPNVVCKVTTHVLDNVADAPSWLAELRDRVGVARLCWGSDHPQHPGSYATKLDRLARATAVWPLDEVETMVASTAERLFGSGKVDTL